jgi:hypothetical protein
MKTFKQFINEDKAQKGEGDVLWHVSSRNRNLHKSFDPMSHFGTQEAAREVGQIRKKYDKPEKTKSAYAVRIRHGKSFEIDDIGDHNPNNLLGHLHDKGMFSSSEYNEHKTHICPISHNHKTINADNTYLAKAINKKGYDSLHYQNDNEDYGSTSHIITRPDQVRVVKSRGHKNRDLSLRNKPISWARKTLVQAGI